MRLISSHIYNQNGGDSVGFKEIIETLLSLLLFFLSDFAVIFEDVSESVDCLSF
jgi:hypothetical protein